jgi:hypothetical protein
MSTIYEAFTATVQMKSSPAISNVNVSEVDVMSVAYARYM